MGILMVRLLFVAVFILGCAKRSEPKPDPQDAGSPQPAPTSIPHPAPVPPQKPIPCSIDRECPMLPCGPCTPGLVITQELLFGMPECYKNPCANVVPSCSPQKQCVVSAKVAKAYE